MMVQHVLESQQFSDHRLLQKLFDRTDGYVSPFSGLWGKGRFFFKRKPILGLLFYEPSTRTRWSFESAACRLGWKVISTENAREFSSAAKGESIEDTIRVVGSYVDAIVLRHYEEGAAKRAAAVSSVPIINAGDGAGQHPTQALLDLYTIKRELGCVGGHHFVLAGDLKHGRTIRSLAYLLGRYSDVRITFVSPPMLQANKDIKEYLTRHNVSWEESDALQSVVDTADVLYMTRVQKERFSELAQYESCKGSVQLTRALAERMKPRSIIMHPLPRVDEIEMSVDSLPQARYFKQTAYGVPVRMALLEMVLKW